jgi:hypothetical protein
MIEKIEKGAFRRKLHGGLVFFGMVVNFLVIGMIFYFLWTRDPNAKPPSFKYGGYHTATAPQPK